MESSEDMNMSECCIFTWNIENFNYSFHKFGEAIESPQFCSDILQSTEWCLKVYPRSKHKSDSIACYLKRNEKGPQEIVLNVEIAFCGADDSIIKKSWVNKTCERNNDQTFFVLAKRCEIFAETGAYFLPDDILTVRCIFKKNDTGISTVEQHFGRTRFELIRKLISGTVNYFSNLTALTYSSRNVDITSEPKDIHKISMELHLVYGANSDENLMLQIIIPENQRKKHGLCKVYLLDAEKNKLECGRSRVNFDASVEWKILLFPTLWELMAKNNLYLPNDILTLECEIIISTGVLSAEIKRTRQDIISLPSWMADSDRCQEPTTSLRAVDDYINLYESQILCDVTLKTNTESFNAHKAFLAARSPVFHAMFTSDMKEKINDCVTISDFDSETVSDMLYYIYGQPIGDLKWDAALQLYAAADKYAIDSLRKECSDILKKSLCTSKACELLVLANSHHDISLKKFVQNYILQNYGDILCSNDWNSLKQRETELTIETLTQMFTNMKVFSI